MTSTATVCILWKNNLIRILDQAKGRDPDWQAMINANIEIFEMLCEESVSYFKHLYAAHY
jgi:hypothetical protein